WPRQSALHVEGLTFAYGPDAEPVIRDLTFDIADGGHLAVVGPSGIGKSTLAGLLTGLLSPRHGHIRLGGFALSDIDERWSRRIAFSSWTDGTHGSAPTGTS